MFQQKIVNLLKAGHKVVIGFENDEVLAMEAIDMVAKAMPGGGKLEVFSVTDPNLFTKLGEHRSNGTGIAVVPDMLQVMGQNPMVMRAIREFALKNYKAEPPFPRLILLEKVGTEVPTTLRHDVGIIHNELAGVDDLVQEVDLLLKNKPNAATYDSVKRREIARACAGLARMEAHKLLCQCWVENSRELDAAWISKHKAARIMDQWNGAITIEEPNSADVGGMEKLKEWIKLRQPAFASDKAKAFGLGEPKGLVLVSPPGCGKSAFSKQIAKMFNVPLGRLDAGKLFNKFVGESESSVRQAIKVAEAMAPMVLWIDEIDKGFAGMGGGGGDSGTTQRVFGTLLTWLQEKTAPVFVVATANNVANLPPELLRKGRFDEIFFVDLPKVSEREEIARIHILKRGRKVEDVNPKLIAENTDGFTGAEIEQAIVEGLYTAFAANRDLVTTDVIVAARATTPLSRTMSREIEALRQWATGKARPASKDSNATSRGSGLQRGSVEEV